jgi:hypothetical protein
MVLQEHFRKTSRDTANPVARVGKIHSLNSATGVDDARGKVGSAEDTREGERCGSAATVGGQRERSASRRRGRHRGKERGWRSASLEMDDIERK